MGTTLNSPGLNASLNERIEGMDWNLYSQQLLDDGYAIIPRLLSPDECSDIIRHYDDPQNFRKTVNMARHRFGLGEYKYFRYPLPEIIQTIRTHFYPPLSGVANTWNRVLKIDHAYPPLHDDLLKQCRLAGQLLPTPLILKYGSGGYNALHQDLYGDVYFPIQAVFLLSDPDTDFTGGEFVLVEQVPRAQSKAIVLNIHKGDALLFTTKFRPEKGSKGYYRIQVRHGVSKVREGNRYSMGIIFHDATR